jgi:hypothetical protein
MPQKFNAKEVSARTVLAEVLNPFSIWMTPSICSLLV